MISISSPHMVEYEADGLYQVCKPSWLIQLQSHFTGLWVMIPPVKSLDWLIFAIGGHIHLNIVNIDTSEVAVVLVLIKSVS